MVMARKQTLVQLTDELVAELDAAGSATGRSRSELIRLAVSHYLAEVMTTDEDRQIVDAYARVPPAADPWVEASASAMISQEPW